MAKGYIVDKIANRISRDLCDSNGSVNAGGDICFFGTAQPSVKLRLGSTATPLFREMTFSKAAIATSSPTRASDDPDSSSRYDVNLREGLLASSTVAVIADCCANADALTKVGLFAARAERTRAARVFNAQILTFDAGGQLIEALGAE